MVRQLSGWSVFFKNEENLAKHDWSKYVHMTISGIGGLIAFKEKLLTR
jgi:hypothetical protein